MAHSLPRPFGRIRARALLHGDANHLRLRALVLQLHLSRNLTILRHSPEQACRNRAQAP